MDPVYQVVLDGGGPWGFRLQGGKDFGIPLNIARITPGSKAAIKNMMVGDAILEINGTPTEQLSHMDAQNVIKNSGNRLELKLRQGSGVSIGDQNARAMGAAAAQPKVLLSTDLTHSAGVDHKFNAKPRPFFGSSPASTEVSPVTSPQEAPKPVVQAPKFSASAYAHKKKEELERRQNEKVSMEDSEVLKMIQKSKISDDNKHPQPYNGSQQPQQDETVEVTAPQAFKMVYSGRDIHEEVPASSRGVIDSLKERQKESASGLSSESKVPSRVFQMLQKQYGDEEDLPPPPPELIDEELSEEKAPGIQSRTFMRLQHAVDTGEGDNVATVFSQPPGQRSKAVPMPNTSAHFGPKGQQTTSVNAIPKPPMPGGPSPPSGPNFRISTPKAPTINKAPPTQSYNKSPSAFTPAAPSSAPSHASQVVHTRSSPKPVSPAETGRTPRCYGCDELIKGPFVSAIGKCWHPEHFCCASCHSSLQNQGFVEEQNKLYCEKCFNDFFAPKCAACGKSIVGNCINAIGKAFHPEHFVCSKCGKPFGNEGFLIEAGKPYCEADYDELFGVKCAQCRRSITGGERYVEALDKNWHSDCFSCGVCHTKLEGSSFYVVQGRPYCGQHKGGY